MFRIGGMRVAGMRPTWWTAARKEEVWQRWKAGESAADIARALEKKSSSPVRMSAPSETIRKWM